MTPYFKDGTDTGVWLQQEILSPFIPADLNISIFVHSVRDGEGGRGVGVNEGREEDREVKKENEREVGGGEWREKESRGREESEDGGRGEKGRWRERERGEREREKKGEGEERRKGVGERQENRWETMNGEGRRKNK